MDPYQTTFQTWNKVAALYQEKFMDLDLYDDTYDRFCQLVEKPGAKVFEIGCGPGNITRYIRSKRPDFQIEAIDVAPNMIRLARENNPTVRFKVMDCREIDKIRDRFDGIICGFCMTYLSREDCAKLFKDCSSLLNSGGIAYFSTIEGHYSKSGYEAGSTGDQTYVYYYEEDYLRQAFKENGFEPIDVTRKHYTKTNGNASTEMIFIVGKK
jgi:2-polyprenyl-3-methyl-5-hydroxy-6-metoxy-1,4-benzoquinol methylase